MNVIFHMSIHLVYKVQECSCSYAQCTCTLHEGIRIDKLAYFGKNTRRNYEKSSAAYINVNKNNGKKW